MGKLTIYDLHCGTDWLWFEWKFDGSRAVDNVFGEQSFASQWQTPELIPLEDNDGSLRPICDCPHHVNPRVLIFSRRAIDCLHDLLTPHAEILPLRSDLGDFVAINLMRQIDCLDYERSVVKRFDHSQRVMMVDKFAFHAEEIGEIPIFRIPEQEAYTFVTDVFLDRVKECQLTGFEFKRLWSSEDSAR